MEASSRALPHLSPSFKGSPSSLTALHSRSAPLAHSHPAMCLAFRPFPKADVAIHCTPSASSVLHQLPNPSLAPSKAGTRTPPSTTARAAAGKNREPYVEPTFVLDFAGASDSDSRHQEGRLDHRSGAEPSSGRGGKGGGTPLSPLDELPPLDRTTPGTPPQLASAAVLTPSHAQPGPLPSLSRPPSWTSPSGDDLDRFRVPSEHKSGYVALVGQPNAGKSTLLNALIGQKLSIVTNKPQTTRHRILGLCSAKDYQIVLYDTPGVIPKVAHKLDDCMMHSVRSATLNADCLVLVVDATLPPQKLESLVESGGGAVAVLKRKPCLVVLNKKDALKPGELAQKVQWYNKEAERCLKRPQRKATEGEGEGEGEEWVPPAMVLPVSAKHKQGTKEMLQWMLDSIPHGPAYYPKDVVSELPERFFVAEILREQLLMQYRQEVPYACQVVVRMFKERQVGKDYIAFDIMVERESQKGILLGKGGMALKALATNARLAIEEFLGREAFLEIVVKVKENWREDEELLKQFGLNAQSRGDWY